MSRLSVCLLTLLLPASLGLAAPKIERPLEPAPVPAGRASHSEHQPVPLVPRGQMLYENHCLGCHESVLFIRERRDVKSLPDLRREVARWAREARAPWRDEEIAEVTRHLNRTFYRFPEP